MFKKATKEKAKAKVAFVGPAGSGKTYSALSVATHMGKRVALIDTEHGSASKYADIFEFDTVQLESFAPEKYIESIHAAEEAGYDVLVIDSLSHAWAGKDGILEFVDREKQRSGNAFSNGWGKATPKHNALVEAILACKIHLIMTLRSKMEYVQEKDDKGKTVIRKVGMQPIQRDGLEYEADLVGDFDQDNTLTVTKSRCPALSRAVIDKPGKDFAKTLLSWLETGAEPAPRPEPASGMTDAQRKRAHAVANEYGKGHEHIKAAIKKLFGKESSKDVVWTDEAFEKLLKELKEEKVA